MKNKIIIVMGIVISIGLTACNSDMVVNNKDVVEAMAQEAETSLSIEESSTEEETTTEAESVTEEETTTDETNSEGNTDGLSVDGEVADGEYTQLEEEETTNEIDPNNLTGDELTEYLDSLTQEELRAMDPDVLVDLIYKEMYGDESDSVNGGGNESNWIPGNPVEGVTPSDGILPPDNFGSAGDPPAAAAGHHIQ